MSSDLKRKLSYISISVAPVEIPGRTNYTQYKGENQSAIVPLKMNVLFNHRLFKQAVVYRDIHDRNSTALHTYSAHRLLIHHEDNQIL